MSTPKLNAALQQVQQALTLLDLADSLLAQATHTLETDGAYDTHDMTDAIAPAREQARELEELLRDYVNV